MTASTYTLNVKLRDLKVSIDKLGVEKASADIGIDGSNFSGSGFGEASSLELIEVNGK